MNRITEIISTLAFIVAATAVIIGAWYVWHHIGQGLAGL